MGRPDARVQEVAGEDMWRVRVDGFDYFDIEPHDEGESDDLDLDPRLTSGEKDDISAWFLDPDYDGRCLVPRQAFFPMASASAKGWNDLKSNVKAELDEELLEIYGGTESLPFKAGKHRRAAVKLIDKRGIESVRVLPLRLKGGS